MTGTDRATVTVGPASRVQLHGLTWREDGAEWIVGRPESRTFVAMPEAGITAIRLLDQGLSVAEAEKRLLAETGEELDLAEFVHDLMDLGFVARAEGRPVESGPVRPPTLPRLRPEHVRFLLSPLLPLLPAVLVAGALVALVLRPDLVPTYRSMLWSERGSVVIVSGAVVGWSIVLLHELAHLAVARAAGVPGRIGFGTRLQFLVAQTDISGIELAPRRHRLTAYLAGIGVNLCVGATAFLLLTVTAPGSAPHRLLAATVLWAVLPLTFQLMMFMRTDVYFVLQDLTGCRDLYGDGRAYARHLAARLLRRHTGAADPSLALPPTERRAVRIYSLILVVGTTLCLAALAAYTVPAELRLVATAVGDLRTAPTGLDLADALLTLASLATVHALWFTTRWRNRQSRRRS
ncbi:site-2 protease family protein [Streptomyces sp. NPDC050803]|uniref:site-2 protease family protein n=1 Tax=unclassified Streptomyces TaxID=2593676 RepID=UPI00344A43F8